MQKDIVSEMTYNVLMGTLNPTLSLTHSLQKDMHGLALNPHSSRLRITDYFQVVNYFCNLHTRNILRVVFLQLL